MELVTKWILTHLSPADGLMFLIMLTLFKIYLKIKGFIDRLERVEKRHGKMVQVMEQCPSSTKAIVAWLNDDRQNSRPPTPARCEIPCTKDLKNEIKNVYQSVKRN